MTKTGRSKYHFNAGLFFYILVMILLVVNLTISFLGEFFRFNNSNAKFDIGRFSNMPNVKITSIGITFPFNFFKKAKLVTQDGISRSINLIKYEQENDSYKLYFDYNIIVTFYLLEKSLSIDVSMPDEITKHFKSLSLPWNLSSGYSSDSDGNEVRQIYSNSDSYYVFYNAQETFFDTKRHYVSFSGRGKNLLVIGEQDIGAYKSFNDFWEASDREISLEEQDVYFRQLFRTISVQLDRYMQNDKIFIKNEKNKNSYTIDKDRLLTKMSISNRLGVFDSEFDTIKNLMTKKRIEFTPDFANYTGTKFEKTNTIVNEKKLAFVQEQADNRNPDVFKDLSLPYLVLDNDSALLRRQLVKLASSTRFAADEDLEITVGRLHFISQLLLLTSNRSQISLELDTINYIVDILKEKLISLNSNLYLYDGKTLHLYASSVMASNLYALGQSDLVKNRILWVKDKNEFNTIALYLFKAISSRTSGNGQIARTATWREGNAPEYSRDTFYLFEIVNIISRYFYKPMEFDQTNMLGSSLKVNTLSPNVFSMYEYDNRKQFKLVLDLPKGISYSYLYNIPAINTVRSRSGFVKNMKDAIETEEAWSYDVSKEMLTIRHNVKNKASNISEYSIAMANPLEGSLDFMIKEDKPDEAIESEIEKENLTDKEDKSLANKNKKKKAK